MIQNVETQDYITCKSQLTELFYNGCKCEKDFKVGIELEKIGVNKYSYNAAPYSGIKGIAEFLKEFKHTSEWKNIEENGNIIGLVNPDESITLEPGSQTEISLSPQSDIHSIYNHIKNYNKVSADIADKLDIQWLGYGIQPLSTYDSIEILPKKRYGYMSEYLPAQGSKALVMMKESAGIQVAVDYSSERDAIDKLRAGLVLSPFVSAMFANSPLRNSEDTGYKSYRAYAWLNTDNNRCGLISEKLFDIDYEFSFQDYTEVLLDIPMIFLKKDDRLIDIKIPFKEYLKHGYHGYKATKQDWELHLSLFFPDVRLKNYIELRNCDCLGSDLIFAVPALWKGIMYNDESMQTAFDLVKNLSWQELNEIRSLSPKLGLETPVKNCKILDIAKELVNIADFSLKKDSKPNNEGNDESIYLNELKVMLDNNQSPADMILHNWHGEWNKDLSKLVKYTQLK